MRKAVKAGILLVVVVFLLSACAPYVLTTFSVRGKTFTYVMSNGHDVSTMTFDSTGKAGTWEYREYVFDYPTQAAVDSAKYTDRAWFQDTGFKGTFTYDPATFMMESNFEQVWEPRPTATAMTNGQYAAADYAYQAPATAYGTDTYTWTRTAPAIFTQDGGPTIYLKGSAANTWEMKSVMVQTSTTSGVTTTSTDTGTTTLTIQDGSITKDSLGQNTTTVTGQATTYGTDRETWNYTISNNFLIGKDTGTKTFADIWKKGNKVSFQLAQTQRAHLRYQGTTAPPAPTVDPTTGTGGTEGGATPYYYITRVGGVTTLMDFENTGDYIIDLQTAVSAYRTFK